MRQSLHNRQELTGRGGAEIEIYLSRVRGSGGGLSSINATLLSAGKPLLSLKACIIFLWDLMEKTLFLGKQKTFFLG